MFPSSIGTELTIYNDSAFTSVVGTTKTTISSYAGLGYIFSAAGTTVYFTVKGTTGSASESWGALYNIIVQPSMTAEGTYAAKVPVPSTVPIREAPIIRLAIMKLPDRLRRGPLYLPALRRRSMSILILEVWRMLIVQLIPLNHRQLHANTPGIPPELSL